MKLNVPLVRHPANPILTPDQMPFDCMAVYNSGAVWFKDRVLMILRAEDSRRENSFYLATSTDGIKFDVSPKPIDLPRSPLEVKYDTTRFDVRITPLEGSFYLCYASWAAGCSIAMARTDDFEHFEAVGSLSLPANRNAALFPRKINGRYARLERPQNQDGSGRMWVNFSPDLLYWGDARLIELTRTRWNGRKLGAGAIPIETDAGWLEIYHGTTMTASTENYYLGVVLLDLDDPSKVIASPPQFILEPREVYECIGQVPNVVFTAGAVEMPDGMLNVYYGGADTRMCLAQTTVKQLLSFCGK